MMGTPVLLQINGPLLTYLYCQNVTVIFFFPTGQKPQMNKGLRGGSEFNGKTAEAGLPAEPGYILGSAHTRAREMGAQPPRSLQEKQSFLVHIQIPKALLWHLGCPWGCHRDYSHPTPKGRYYDHFCFTEQELWLREFNHLPVVEQPGSRLGLTPGSVQLPTSLV